MECADSVTMRAQSAARSRGNAARMERTPDMVPSVNAASHSESSICSKYPSPGPMVWTRLFSCPQRSETAAKPAVMEAASAMSTLIPTASGAPASRSASTAASSAPLPRAITATLAPSAARVFAIASPIPLLPPVTTAFDPVKPRSIDSPLVSVARWVVRRDAESAQTEPERMFADVGAFAISCRPLPFGAGPDHALHGLCFGQRIDVVEQALVHAALELFDERLEHLGVCGLDQLGGGEHLRLRLEGQAAQIGLDVLVEREVESAVDPCGDRLNR